MRNEQRITWVSGPASGFYIDLESQKIGYSGKEKSLNHLQTRLLSFMLSFPGGFVTAGDTAGDSELFSIDLSKYISAIKSAVRSLIRSVDPDADAGAFADQIIEKRSTYGNTGYRLRTELTDELDDAPSETTATIVLDPVKDSLSEDPSPLGIKRYLKYNWLPLFIYMFLILGIILLADSLQFSVHSLLAQIVTAPFGITFTILSVVSALPILGGMFIDVPLSVREYSIKKGLDPESLDKESIHKIAMYLIPRFDNSKEHILFFLICNLTGAFTVSSVLLYVKSIPGLIDYLPTADHGYAYSFIILAGCFVALFNNYSLQTTYSSDRCADDFILSRAHAFLNLIHLTVSLSFGGCLIYTFLSFRFVGGSGTSVITPAYIVMILAAYCYMWFSSDSPAAQKIDSISKNNFITGLPIAVVITTVYTVFCFAWNIPSIIALLTAPAFLALWLVCFLRRRKENTLKLYYFVSSFFSVMAIALIVLLVLSAFGV